MSSASVVALVLLAGCTSGTGGQGASSTSDPGGGPTSTLRPTDTSFSGQGSGEFCTEARAYSERSGGLDPSATPAKLRADATEGQRAIARAVALAPAEIKPDVEVLSAGFTALLAALAGVNYDVTKVTPGMLAPLQAPEFGRATQRFQAYVRDVCKVPA